MGPIRLSEKWGSKEIWLRALFVRTALIWLFREEFTELELGKLQSLEPVLGEAYRAATSAATKYNTNKEAFESALEAVGQEIDRRIRVSGGNVELEQLKKLVNGVHDSDPLRQMFNCLARKARGIYRTCPRRSTTLEREWLIGHPYGESIPGHYHDPYHVNAETRLSGNKAYIELQIYLDQFDVYSLLVVPALLTHELVCHAHANEDRYSHKSYWAEGFMDWAAAFYLNLWAPWVDLPYGLVKNHCGHLWDTRMTPWRYTGRLAADALVEWFTEDRSVRHTSVAQHLTARFALEVNVVDAALPLKDELASRLLNIRRDDSLRAAVHAWHHEAAPAASLLM